MNLLATTTRLDRLEQIATATVKVAPAAAAGVTATAHAGGAFAKGAYVQIIPAAAVTSRFRLSAIISDNQSAADEYEIDIAKGLAAAEVIIATIKVPEHGRFLISSDYLLPGTRISARIGVRDAVARTCDISVEFSDNLI